MNRIFVWSVLLVSLFLFISCATPHVVLLKDGTTIETRDTPDFDKKAGFYRYETVDGMKGQINKDAIVEIKEKK